MAADLRNLPPALVAGGCELFGCEGETDARRLTVAGHDHHNKRPPSMADGFIGMSPLAATRTVPWPEIGDSVKPAIER
jgi:hypothetical protein